MPFLTLVAAQSSSYHSCEAVRWIPLLARRAPEELIPCEVLKHALRFFDFDDFWALAVDAAGS